MEFMILESKYSDNVDESGLMVKLPLYILGLL